MQRIMLHLDRCNGCLTCTLACAAAHSKSGHIIGAMMEGVQSRIHIQSVKGKAVPVLCRHCEEPACVDACMAGAMQKNPVTGIVTNDGNEQSCVGCWMCIMACPYGVIVQSKDGTVAVKCDGCKDREIPACVEACHTRALEYMDVDEFAAVKRQETAYQLAKPAV